MDAHQREWGPWAWATRSAAERFEMRGSLDDLPILIARPRWRLRTLALVSVILALGGLWSFFAPLPDDDPWLVPIGVGFACCAIFYMLRLRHRDALQIDEGGLCLISGGRTCPIAWHEVGAFRVERWGRRDVVTFDLLEPDPGMLSEGDPLDDPSDFAGCLDDGYEISPARLASLLNEARQRWGTGQ
jgi:hypothetical protein